MGGAISGYRFLLGLGLLLLAVAFANSTVQGDIHQAQAASAGPEMALSIVSGGVCDPQNPTDCTVQTGAQFVLSIDAVTIPASGYVLAQGWIDYGDLLGDPSASGAIKASNAPWPDCLPEAYLALNTDEAGTSNLDSYYAGCLTSQVPPFPISTYSGSLFTITLTCPSLPTIHTVDLVPSGTSPAGTSGAQFTDADSNQVVPKVNSLTIDCNPYAPPPYASPEINGTLFESPSGFFRGVTVYLAPMGNQAVTSELDGSFSFFGVPDGSYKISVGSCSFYGCFYKTFVNVAGSKISVDIYPKGPDDDTDGDLILNSVDPDDDNDGCTDLQELGPDPALGGTRDPHDRHDYYDVLGFGGAPPDQVIDLSNDILGVILHFSPTGYAPGTPALVGSGAYEDFDRGPADPVHGWPTAPDGVIDLANDILGVILQFGHDCA